MVPDKSITREEIDSLTLRAMINVTVSIPDDQCLLLWTWLRCTKAHGPNEVNTVSIDPAIDALIRALEQSISKSVPCSDNGDFFRSVMAAREARENRRRVGQLNKV